jgi:hypothetical protein
MTHNEIVKLFKRFADGHSVVKAFAYGPPDAQVLKNVENYPLMYVIPVSVDFDDNAANAGGLENQTFDVYFLDVPAIKESSFDAIREVVSDMVNVARDFRTVINNDIFLGQFMMRRTANGSFNVIMEDFADTLTGVQYTIVISQPQNNERCLIPGLSPGGVPIVCPTLCEQITEADWEEIKACMSSGQIDEAITDLCDGPPPVCPDLCELISEATADEVVDCLSPEQLEEVEALVCAPCPPSDPATVTLNGVTMATIPCGDTENIQVRQQTGSTLVGSQQGQHWRIANSPISINGSAFTNLPAEDSLNIAVTQDGNPVGSLVGGAWVVPPCPPPDPKRIYSMPFIPTATTQYANFDTKWRCDNGFYDPKTLTDVKAIRQLVTNAATLSAAGFAFPYMMTEVNVHGHFARFTLANGSYAVALDQWRDINGNVIGLPGAVDIYDHLYELVWWNEKLSATTNWTNSIVNPATFTLGGNTGYFLPSRKEIMTLTSESVNGRYHALNVVRGGRDWTSDTDPSTTANAFWATAAGVGSAAKTTTAGTTSIYCRKFDSTVILP